MKEWLKELLVSHRNWCIDALDDRGEDKFITDYLRDNPLPLPKGEEVFNFLKEQNYQKEGGEQEYYMYYDVDMPKIIRDWIKLKMK